MNESNSIKSLRERRVNPRIETNFEVTLVCAGRTVFGVTVEASTFGATVSISQADYLFFLPLCDADDPIKFDIKSPYNDSLEGQCNGLYIKDELFCLSVKLIGGGRWVSLDAA